MAIVSVVSLQRVQGSAPPGRDPHETESLAMSSAPMGHADRMVRVAPVTLPALHGAVSVPGVTAHPTLTAVQGRLVIGNLARSATMPLATMTRRLTPMRFPPSSTELPGVS